MTPLLAWSQDDLLAQRSGYHVLADYLEAPRVVTHRSDPTAALPLFLTRVARRFAASRWYSGGSWKMEWECWKHSRTELARPVHMLWCDRDLGFLDLFLDRPLIGTFHQCADDLSRVIRRPSALKKLAAIILMSDSQRGWFVSHGVSPDRLHVILHGVDVEHFTPLSFDPPPAFNVLAVGGTRRNFPLMRAVASALPELRFTIVGPPDKRSFFAGMDHVTYHQSLSDEALVDLYRTSGCLLHLPENATANNVLLEALACALPVVTHNVGGIPEYTAPACAYVAPAQDGTAVIETLRALAADSTQQANMRKAARNHALKFDWRIVAKATAAVYATTR